MLKLLLLFLLIPPSTPLSKYASSINTDFLELFFFFLFTFFKDDNFNFNIFILSGEMLINFGGRRFLLFFSISTFILFNFCLMLISILFNLVEDTLLIMLFLISKISSFGNTVLSIYLCVFAFEN